MSAWVTTPRRIFRSMIAKDDDDDELAVSATESSGTTGATARGTGRGGTAVDSTRRGWWCLASPRFRLLWPPRQRPAAADDDEEQLKREWAKVDGMSPPKPPGGVSLPVSLVERRMRSDGYHKHVSGRGECDRDERGTVYYLYGRGVGWGVSRSERKELIAGFIGNPKAAARMKRYLTYDHGSASSLHSGGHRHSHEQHLLWRKGQETVLRYASPADPRAVGGGGATIFRGTLLPYLQLQQGYNTCFLTAAFILVNYKVNQSKFPSQGGDVAAELAESYKVELVDMNRYIRHRFDNETLKKRVVDDEGGSSVKVLRDLVGSRREFDSVGFPKPSRPSTNAERSRIIANFLLLNGPALVPCFDMTVVRKLLNEHLEEEEDDGAIRLPSFDFQRGGGTLVYRELGTYGNSEAVEAAIARFETANGGSLHHSHIDEGTVVRNLNNNSLGGSINEEDDSGSQSPTSSRGDNSRAAPPERAGRRSSHAMVLIGFRKDPAIKGKCWFLLQNPWKRLPLLEVSQAFIAEHLRGTLVFIRGDVPASVSTFTRRDDDGGGGGCLLHDECSYDDDGGDGFIEEEEEEEEDEEEGDGIDSSFVP
jgi:hypothetical protein